MQVLATEEETVAAYLSSWLQHAKTRVRTKTYEGYETLVRLYARPGIGDLPLAAVTPLVLQRLYADLLTDPKRHLSGGTVLNLHLVLTQAFSQGVRWGVMASNPAAGAQPPRPRRAELVVVDEALAATLLELSLGTRFEAPVALAIATGMRRGEILALRWSDVAPDLVLAHVRRSVQPTAAGLVFEQPKTKKSRRAVVLPAFLAPYLRRQRADQERRRRALEGAWVHSDLVIDGGDGRPLNPGTLSSGWASFVRKKGLPAVRFHDLRHAHATLMLSKGVHPKIVSERLGHASVGITLDTYSHVLPSMQAEAAAAFDEIFESKHDASES
jgi:integrase